MDAFHDFHFKPHFDHDGQLKGFTQNDYAGNKHYFDQNGGFEGMKIKNHITDHSDYYDSSNKHLGTSIDNVHGHDFIKGDGTFGHHPKMFELKDPNFHTNVHNHFSSHRDNMLSQIK